MPLCRKWAAWFKKKHSARCPDRRRRMYDCDSDFLQNGRRNGLHWGRAVHDDEYNCRPKTIALRDQALGATRMPLCREWAARFKKKHNARCPDRRRRRRMYDCDSDFLRIARNNGLNWGKAVHDDEYNCRPKTIALRDEALDATRMPLCREWAARFKKKHNARCPDRRRRMYDCDSDFLRIARNNGLN